MDGVLLINKPAGCTSHDVCLQVKRTLKTAKVGHTGTLDPMATGVLVVCVNNATKLVQFLMQGEKEYAACMRLGIATDTQDITGEVLDTPAGPLPDRAALEAACREFTGDIEQLPPMYSALKQGGVPLYRLAREGKTVERQPRRVTVAELEVLGWEPPEARLRVVCSPGTYIRTLCHDIGSRLCCGGVLSSLERVATGGFHLRDALPLEALESLSAGDICRNHMIAMDDALRGLPEVVVDAAMATRLRNGLAVTQGEMRTLDMPELCGGKLLKIRQCGGGLVGVGETVTDSGLACDSAPALKTVRVFAR